jgi:hypothetical protein
MKSIGASGPCPEATCGLDPSSREGGRIDPGSFAKAAVQEQERSRAPLLMGIGNARDLLLPSFSMT